MMCILIILLYTLHIIIIIIIIGIIIMMCSRACNQRLQAQYTTAPHPPFTQKHIQKKKSANLIIETRGAEELLVKRAILNSQMPSIFNTSSPYIEDF